MSCLETGEPETHVMHIHQCSEQEYIDSGNDTCTSNENSASEVEGENSYKAHVMYFFLV